ncbi:MAG: hypothetical protein AAF597_09845, partial [Bacteroidota bacterium]
MADMTPQKSTLANWLNSIQQDSWQLELVISGVAIFLLIGAHAPLQELSDKVALDVLTNSTVLVIVGASFLILRFAYYALVLTFLLHLLLR